MIYTQRAVLCYTQPPTLRDSVFCAGSISIIVNVFIFAHCCSHYSTLLHSFSTYCMACKRQLGPVTETSLQPQRIYLYNRQVLTGEQGLPAPSRLPPLSVGAPAVDDPSMGNISDVSALLEKASSPLLRALPDFERQFLRNLKRWSQSTYPYVVYCVMIAGLLFCVIDNRRNNFDCHCFLLTETVAIHTPYHQMCSHFYTIPAFEHR